MTYDARCRLSGWVVSGVLHLCAVSVATILVAEVKPPTDPTPFHWEVSLVEAVNRSDSTQPHAAPAEPAPPSPKVQQNAAPKPTVVTRQALTRVEEDRQDRRERIERQVQPVVQQAEAVQELTRQAIRPVLETMTASERQPVQERIATTSVAQTAEEPVPVESATMIDRIQSTPAVASAAPAEVARGIVPHNAAESVTPPAPAVVERAAPVETTPSVVDTVQSAVSRAVTSVPAPARPEVNPTTVMTMPEPVPELSEPRSAAVSQQAAVPPTPTAASVQATPEPQPPNSVPDAIKSAAGDARESVGRDTDQVVAKSAVPQPTARADYRWLAESLYRRIAELKRYPNAARLNGWEGKVVLRAVIKADGNLADLRVQTSSGFDALDEAALETVRQACPLHLKHALGRPEVVVSLPIVYSLSN